MFLKSLTSSIVLFFLVSPALGSSHAGAIQQGLANHTQSQIPGSLRPALYKALENGTSGTHPTAGNDCFSVPGQHFQACFDKHGAHFESAGAALLSLHLEAWGRGSSLHPVRAVAPTLSRHQISYGHGQLTEWWRVLPIGFEQGFTITRRHEGNGPLTVILAAGRTASSHNDSLGWGKVRYGHLVVTDANGKKIPSFISSRGNQILIHIRDKQASYPLTVDPLVWIENKVTASDGGAGDYFGLSVAVSGNTAMIGAPQPSYGSNGNGAVYVFTKLNDTWSQTQKLVASNPTTGDEFGCSVAISGTTAVIGACFGNGGGGSAYVFTESSGIWNQAQILTSLPADYFGYSVAISGSTIIIGAPFSSIKYGDQGAAYVFAPSGTTWTQAAQLTASDAAYGDQFGWSVGIDGNTAIVGSELATVNGNTSQGAAYIYTDSGGTWTQSQKLTASDGAAQDDFGWAVSISGNTALVGANGANVNGSPSIGAVYVFENASGTWTQAQKLTAGSSSVNEFGWSVAVSGATALVGSPGGGGNTYGAGSAFVYTDQSGSWQQVQKLSASDGTINDYFGDAVSLDGANFLVGTEASVGGNNNQGAAYFYKPSNLGITVSAPPTATQGNTFTSQIIVTNASSTASNALLVGTMTPSSATLVSATPSQGSCSRTTGPIDCAIGSIGGNGGSATINLKLKATGAAKSMISSAASVANATPALTAGAATEIITPPTAQNGSITDTENSSTNGTMHASDPDGEPVKYSIVSPPSHGSVSVTNASAGSFTYTPNTGFTGSDSFTFTANDGHADSNIATVSIAVNAKSSSGGSGGGGGTGFPVLLILAFLAGFARRRP